ncbi:hypothetical protein ABEV70_26815 [Priestia megaterium]
MSIKIGDKNKIKNSSVGHNYNTSNNEELKKSFLGRHPILVSIVISLITGFVLLFSFWKKIVEWIEHFFI